MKNGTITLKNIMTERPGLDPGFSQARCKQGEGTEDGQCKHIQDWDRLCIPDLRPGAAPDAWIAVLKTHMDRKRVGPKVKALHKGGLTPWEGDADTGRSLKGDEGVVCT